MQLRCPSSSSSAVSSTSSQSTSRWTLSRTLLVLCACLPTSSLARTRTELPKKPAYAPGQSIPISCLNRTIDTGEHISDDKGQLQYIPFPICNETGKPLELQFGVERETNCTISFISDEFFHLLEFYVHSDAPLTCRIPARPTPDSKSVIEGDAALNPDYIPLIFALSGTFQLSHIHIASTLNILLHAAPRLTNPGVIDSAIAYSTSPLSRTTRVKIGSSLPLRLAVRWYPSTSLPSGWAGVGGHLYASTLVYCLLCIGATAAACLAYFRGVEFPKRMRRYGFDRLGGGGGGQGITGGDGGGGGRLGGYGYIGSGVNGFGGANGGGGGIGIGNGGGGGAGFGTWGGRGGKVD